MLGVTCYPGTLQLVCRVARAIRRIAVPTVLIFSLGGCGNTIHFHNPQPSPNGHGDTGILYIKAAGTVCWNLYRLEDMAAKRTKGCGAQTIQLHNSGGFDIVLTKLDHTTGVLEGVVVSSGRVINHRSTMKYGDMLQLSS